MLRKGHDGWGTQLIIPLKFPLQIAINPKQEDDGGSCVEYEEFYVIEEVGTIMHVSSLGQTVNPAGPGHLFFAEDTLTQG
ncbi:MAG: hypothetical protein ACYCOR_12525 [Acidobacteriaceae bacterium]